MAIPEMGLFRFLKLSVCVAVMVVVALNFADSAVYIHFDQTPPAWSRFSTASFRYSVERADGSNACRNNSCSIYCELDGQRLRPCHVGTVVLRNLTANHEHNFLLNVTTRNGEKNSSAYSWFIDTIPPTAIMSSEQNYTSAEKITIDITFSEACTGHGGFKCVNSSNCDVSIDGPAQVQASSLSIIKPNIKYSLLLVLSMKHRYARVVVRMADDFCKDRAGNNFTRSNASTAIIHFDRRPVWVDLSSSVPSNELAINGVPRTVFATNRMKNLEVYLDFSIPVINSTEQILTALYVNSGSLIPVHERTHGNHRFVFRLKNIASETEIITVKLQAGLLIGRTSTPVSPVAALTFLYDCAKPGVGLSTSSQNVTKESNINAIVEFTKPVFGFEASMIEVNGGRLIRFKELSRALYSLTVLAVSNSKVSITIPEGKVNDISGNMNLASNRLEMVHYSTPAISTALHSFVTSGVLATTLAAAILSLSSTNLGAISKLNSASNNFVASDPSMNLHGMIGHLQVFVLSDWLLSDQPIEYSETTKGLRWLIPRQKLPWKRNGYSIWPNNVYLDQGRFVKRPSSWFSGYLSDERAYHDIGLDNSSYVQRKLLFPAEIDSKFSWLHGRQNISKEDSPFGLPLNSNEYFTFFLRGEPLSASNVVKKLENYKGWQDMAMNLFWLSIGVGSLLIVHFALLVFLRWRIGTAAQGILSVPRFELLLVILMLPCISQSSAFVIRGGTIEGIITGALLLAIPAAFILSVCLFLTITVFTGSLARYKEIRHANAEEKWHKKLWFFLVGRPANGKWFYMDGLPSSFLSRFGILFEDQKGPPLFVFVDQNDSNTMPRWVGSGQNGIGRMRAVSSDDSHEEMKISLFKRFLGCARSSYIIVDLLRRVCLGVISGSYSSHRSSQSVCALTITLLQFLCLFTLKPHIRRGVYIVESISLLSEAGVFGLSISMNKSNSVREKTLGLLMLALLFLSFVAQLVNEWYALIKCLLSISQPHKNSFKLGLKFAAKGLLLPFLPRKHWSRVIPGSSQANSVLVPALPRSRETEFVRRDHREPHGGQFSSMTATVVPLLSPGSPIIKATGTAAETTHTVQKPGESKRGKGLKFDPRNDVKKLRELARASFSGNSKDEETNTSYRYRLQSFSPETVSNDPQTSTSKITK
ncbi:PREDICTED: uncharacterized protein LOC18601011 isoform X1 [Theobroma cacao]|uniref:Uncharacterized protein LOC18601011 isoform X1 n=2 Tax=Theobroma cacao TaxID=3641 RepID=A0AB32W7N3_THECC|nr:PREDICTED: uncharacterized protein LOC18601011 isoform X1 [Theobroma cacao]